MNEMNKDQTTDYLGRNSFLKQKSEGSKLGDNTALGNFAETINDNNYIQSPQPTDKYTPVRQSSMTK